MRMIQQNIISELEKNIRYEQRPQSSNGRSCGLLLVILDSNSLQLFSFMRLNSTNAIIIGKEEEEKKLKKHQERGVFLEDRRGGL